MRRWPYKAEIDSAVLFGGDSGRTELGLSIPANTYAYLYQVNALEGSSITSLRLPEISSFFDVFVELDVMHDGAVDWHYRSEIFDEFGVPFTGEKDVSLAMFEGLGAAGVSSSTWGSDGNDVLATFDGGIGFGFSSNILVGFSTLPPGMPDDRFNAFLSDGTYVAGNGIWMPVPAPGAALLAAMGLGMVGWVKRRRAV